MLEKTRVPDGISIHAPRGGSDLLSLTKYRRLLTFQSTLPVGGATVLLKFRLLAEVFQSTLPVGGAT